MQGLADGYFVLPYTIGKYLSEDIRTKANKNRHESFVKTENKAKDRNKILLQNNGSKSVESFHRDLGKIVWDYCGMSRNEIVSFLPLTKLKIERKFLEKM